MSLWNIKDERHNWKGHIRNKVYENERNVCVSQKRTWSILSFFIKKII